MTIFKALSLGVGDADKHRLIADHLAGQIASGVLAQGDRLPPVRQAAWSVGVHPGTMARAYKALEARGLVHGEVGRGTFVGGASRARSLHLDPPPQGHVDLSINSFSIATPRAALADAFEYAAAGLRAGDLATGYVSETGRLEDRAAILPWLSRRLGDIAPDQVLLTAGGQSGVHAALSSFVSTGAAAACDAVTYPGVITAAVQLGIPLVGIAIDDAGMVPEALEDACRRRRIALLVISPSVQNPTGIAMPAVRRAAIAEIAARHGLIILEDEVYGFLGDETLPSFFSMLPQQAVHLTSLSKQVAPALRIGYLAGPPALLRRAALAQKNCQMMVSPILASAASHIAASGLLERRRDLLLGEVARRYHAAARLLGMVNQVLKPSGLVWLHVPDAWRLGEFCREAERQNVLLAPADLFAVDAGNVPHAVRLSLTAEADFDRLMEAVATISRLLQLSNPVPGAIA